MLANLERLVPPSVLQRCALVPSGSLPTGLFHISTDPELEYLTPRIPLRSLRTEDSTFPRVCVSSSLLGCIYGHSATLADYQAKKPPHSWLGGYIIYRTPFKFALRPHTSLLSDVNISDEHWLFDLGEDIQTHFPAVAAGECFIGSIVDERVKSPDGKTHVAKCPTFYIEVREDGFPLWLCGGEFTVLKAGWYELRIPTYYWRKGVQHPDGIEIARITEAKYREVRHGNYVMLSHNGSGSYGW